MALCLCLSFPLSGLVTAQRGKLQNCSDLLIPGQLPCPYLVLLRSVSQPLPGSRAYQLQTNYISGPSRSNLDPNVRCDDRSRKRRAYRFDGQLIASRGREWGLYS
jgi:hypothetical protein